MQKDQQIEIVRDIQLKELNIIGTKGNDYASEIDILKNFKEVSTICNMLNIDSRTLYGTHLFYIILKIQRICNLLNSNKTAQNESIEDTLLDLRTYVGLLNCSIIEQNK